MNTSIWQKCPVCDGSGHIPTIYTFSLCHCCHGHGILNTLSGLPPAWQKYTTSTTTEIIINPDTTQNKEK